MNDGRKVLIDLSEYEALISYRKKFHQLVDGEPKDGIVRHHYVCGAGFGCINYDNYTILSKDDALLTLAEKLETLLWQYAKMPFWARLRHRPIPGGPYDGKGYHEAHLKRVGK